MSLQLAAQHLSNSGRGNDSTLVHMSPREVNSLNDLAMAHGGQLSINPQTGLPEAGFLSSILPMVAGAALMAAGVPAGYAALGVGAGTTLMTGSLQKGLMAGLGAYGGANLGSGLMASGTDAAVASDAAVQAAQQNAAETLYNPTGAVMTDAQTQSYVNAAQKASMDAATAQAAARTAAAPDFMGKLKAMGSGISSLGQEGGFSNLYQNLGGSPMSLLKSVGASAAPAIGEAMKPKPIEEEKSDADMGQRYSFSMNPTGGQRQVQPGQDPLANTSSFTTTPFPFDSSEKRYFTPSYKKLTAEEAKELYGYAKGGEVDKAESAETPALKMFKQMQAQRAAQPQTPQYASTPATGGSPAANAPVPTTVEGLYTTYLDRTPEKGGADYWNKQFGPDVDANEAAIFRMGAAPELAANRRLAEQTGGPLAHEYGQYLRHTRGDPIQPQAPTTPFGTEQNSTSELMYDPVKQTYIKNPNFVDAEAAEAAAAKAAANAFNYTGGGHPYSMVTAGGNIKMYAAGGLMDAYAGGGMSNLGDYSDGGRLLRGPGDGVSDSIPAMIGKRQPARLADGEFVVPARIVSELGNGSTEAGARKLYAMMDRIQKARGKTVGKGKVAKNSRADRLLPV